MWFGIRRQGFGAFVSIVNVVGAPSSVPLMITDKLQVHTVVPSFAASSVSYSVELGHCRGTDTYKVSNGPSHLSTCVYLLPYTPRSSLVRTYIINQNLSLIFCGLVSIVSLSSQRFSQPPVTGNHSQRTRSRRSIFPPSRLSILLLSYPMGRTSSLIQTIPQFRHWSPLREVSYQ